MRTIVHYRWKASSTLILFFPLAYLQERFQFRKHSQVFRPPEKLFNVAFGHGILDRPFSIARRPPPSGNSSGAVRLELETGVHKVD